VSVVCCQVEVSATSWSLVQRSSTDCGASFCDLENLKNEEAMIRVGSQRQRKKIYLFIYLFVSCGAFFTQTRVPQ